MNIEIKENLIPTLTRLADERSMTTTQYVEEYIDNHLSSQYRTFVANKVASESVENVATIEEVIDTKKEEIQADILADNLVKLEETPMDVSTSTEEVIK